jgi:hypothetical protein
MVKKIFTNMYVIGGLIIFLLLLGIGLFGVQASLGESLFGALVITAIAIGGWWWKEHVW